jgi:hypothetical protein
MTQGLRSANAFLVQFRYGTGSSSARLAGRVEHVATGYSAKFESAEELPKLLQNILESIASPPGDINAGDSMPLTVREFKTDRKKERS